MTLNFYFQNKLSELSLTHPVPFTNHHAKSLPLHRCHDLACLISDINLPVLCQMALLVPYIGLTYGGGQDCDGHGGEIG